MVELSVVITLHISKVSRTENGIILTILKCLKLWIKTSFIRHLEGKGVANLTLHTC
jgi:hypothetical protein